MPNVIKDWYHVRVVALQTKVTVTVTPPAMRKLFVTFHFSYHPILAFANMAVSVGTRSIHAYVMGLVKNNNFIDLANLTKIVKNPFAF